MTAPASIPALIAEGRRLIAEATPGPLKKWGKPDPAQAIEANGRFVATTVGGNDVANADIFVFAVNNLAALLDVAGVADAVSSSVTMAQEREAKDALDSALSRLRGVRS